MKLNYGPNGFFIYRCRRCNKQIIEHEFNIIQLFRTILRNSNKIPNESRYGGTIDDSRLATTANRRMATCYKCDESHIGILELTGIELEKKESQ